ncbi:unnamed protein product [Gadus morhua 'NCC']
MLSLGLYAARCGSFWSSGSELMNGGADERYRAGAQNEVVEELELEELVDGGGGVGRGGGVVVEEEDEVVEGVVEVMVEEEVELEEVEERVGWLRGPFSAADARQPSLTPAARTPRGHRCSWDLRVTVARRGDQPCDPRVGGIQLHAEALPSVRRGSVAWRPGAETQGAQPNAVRDEKRVKTGSVGLSHGAPPEDSCSGPPAPPTAPPPPGPRSPTPGPLPARNSQLRNATGVMLKHDRIRRETEICREDRRYRDDRK